MFFLAQTLCLNLLKCHLYYAHTQSVQKIDSGPVTILMLYIYRLYAVRKSECSIQLVLGEWKLGELTYD